jgi:DNA-binding NarL/FixJ family response regulator
MKVRPPQTRPINVMLLDDHILILIGMQNLLVNEPDLRWVASLTSSKGLEQALEDNCVDVLVLDFQLQPGDIDGLNLIRLLQNQHPKLRLLVISSLHTPATVALALRYGAAGFIGKELPPGELAQAIRRVASGRIYLHPQMLDALRESELSIGHADSPDNNEQASLTGFARAIDLSAREHEVLRCCLSGMSVSQIAEKFNRSIKTISTQKHNAFRKLGLRNDNELFKVQYELEKS